MLLLLSFRGPWDRGADFTVVLKLVTAEELVVDLAEADGKSTCCNSTSTGWHSLKRKFTSLSINMDSANS